MAAPKGNKFAVGNSGRPAEIDVNDMINEFNLYIDNDAYPMVKEFCVNYKISSARFYQLKDDNKDIIEPIIKRLLDKAEVYLAKYSTNTIKDIFTLKQKAFGWTDKTEVEQNTTIQIQMADDLKRLGD